jgi:hypothetical protein
VRLHGWCTSCHKPKRVEVKSPVAKGGVPIGLCSDCDRQQLHETFIAHFRDAWVGATIIDTKVGHRRGTVDGISDNGTIWVSWKRGQTSPLRLEANRYKVVER